MMWGADVFLIWLRNVSTYTPFKAEVFLRGAAEVPMGFALTLLLREVYKRLDHRKMSMVGIFGYISIWSILATTLWYALISFMWQTHHGGNYIFIVLGGIVAMNWISYLAPIIFGWSALYFGIKYWLDWDAERLRARRALALAQRAQLQMLQYQLNPHFLFNALNSVRALVDEDRTIAKGMVTELSEFLWYSLIHRDPIDVPLREELAAIKHYLSIEKKRFEEKLLVSFDVEPAAEDYPVLSFLLHPLVENAVKYGMRTSPMPLTLSIRATVQNGMLMLTVKNTGRWLHLRGEDRADGTGTGLENVRSRLENAYPHSHTFDVMEQEGAVEVRIALEKRRAA